MNIEQKIIAIISEQLSVDSGRIFLSSNLVDDLGAASIDMVQIIIYLEESFDIEINDNQAEKIVTVQAAIDCVESLV